MIAKRFHNGGFTIVELITVMLILGILSVGTVRFINDGANGFASTASRGALVSDSQLTLTRLARDIREALPNSTRVSAGGDCLELIPIVGASVYLAAPIGTSGTTLQAVPLDAAAITASTRVAIAPTANPYGLNNPGSISPVAAFSAPNANNEITVTLASSHQFTQGSAQQRLFLVESPISICRDGNRLWRYQNYGYIGVQPTVADLPSSRPQRSLLADAVDANGAVFQSTSATLERNATIALSFTLQRNGDEMSLNHLVQMRNLP